MADKKGVLGGTELTSGYKSAANAILYFGPKANALLPLLIKRRDEILNALGPDAAGVFIGTLIAAIDAIEGRRPISIPEAVNGSGALTEAAGTPMSQPIPMPLVQEPSPQSTSPLVPTPQAQSTPPARPEQTHSPLLWIVCAIILLVVATGILLRSFRK